MSAVLYVISYFFAFLAGVGILCLCYLGNHTYNITITNFFVRVQLVWQIYKNQSADTQQKRG